MPGLTLVSAPAAHSSSLVPTALSPAFPDRHTSTRLWETSSLDIVATTYPGYPLHVHETDDYWICLEGGLYGTPASETDPLLLNWAQRLLSPSGPCLPRSVLRTDGDFLVVALHKATDRWAVFNDGMGRLPLYRYTTSSVLCLTRTFHLFNRIPDPPSPDQVGIAQQLTFGYPLGRRTLRKNVDHVPPGTVLLSNGAPTSLREHRLNSYDFDAPRRHADRSASENAAHLAERLDQDASARAQWSRGPTVLSLSGGLDSRSIACSLQRTQSSYTTRTFDRPNGRNQSDVEYAQAIARAFDLPHRTVSLPERSRDHLSALLRATGGLLACNVAYMIPYLEAIAGEFGPEAHLLTGNGGALLRALHPPHPLSNQASLSSVDDLLHTLFYDVSRSWMRPKTAAAVAGVSPEALRESVRARLADSPESSLNGQYLHFAFERLFKYSFVGEDRNRTYLWSSAPYHGLHFTEYALHCPNDQKEYYRLYRAFLRALSPKTLQIGYSNFYGFRMTAVQFNLYRALRWIVRQAPPLRRWLNQHRGRTRSTSTTGLARRLIRDCLSPTETSVLAPTAVKDLLQSPGDSTAQSIDNILAILCAFSSEDQHNAPFPLHS